MTEKFMASNGVQVWIDGKHVLQWKTAVGSSTWEATTQAILEFFQNKTDSELGRWRDPDNQSTVVYSDDSSKGCIVFNEKTALRLRLDKTTAEAALQDSLAYSDDFVCAAKSAMNYYNTCVVDPEWYGAEQGEVWVVTTKKFDQLIEQVCQVTSSSKFLPIQELGNQSSAFVVDNPGIITAYRIWPKEN